MGLIIVTHCQEELKCGAMEHGGLCVVTFGISLMLQWFVINWAISMHFQLHAMLPLVKAVDPLGWMM